MRKYQFFGKDKTGAVLPIFEAFADEAPTRAYVDAIHAELSRQVVMQGHPVGSVPRPTHYAVILELIEIEETGEAPPPILIHGARENGRTTH